MEYDRLKLENQLCFPLYACAREVVKLYTPHLDALDLTYTQYVVLLVLWEANAASVKALGEKLYLDSGTLTPLLKKLESRGLLLRTRSEADERSTIVTLTDAGRALRERAASIPERVRSCVRLTDDEAMQLYRLLYKALDGMSAN